MLIISIRTESFDEPASEAARILREAADTIERDGPELGVSAIPLYDVNGNRCGALTVTPETNI